jgi:HemK-related putative methylase
MEIYQPAEDSYLLAEVLTDYLSGKTKQIKILDMGSGSGIQAQTCLNLGFNNILTADINKEAVENLKKQGFRSIHSDLFSNINKKEKFDLIIFNPPYLPEHKYDKEKDTTGGKKGFETIIKFLKQAKNNLNKNGNILLLFSSFSQPKIIIEKAKLLGYKTKELSSKKLFFEELFVCELKI